MWGCDIGRAALGRGHPRGSRGCRLASLSPDASWTCGFPLLTAPLIMCYWFYNYPGTSSDSKVHFGENTWSKANSWELIPHTKGWDNCFTSRPPSPLKNIQDQSHISKNSKQSQVGIKNLHFHPFSIPFWSLPKMHHEQVWSPQICRVAEVG